MSTWYFSSGCELCLLTLQGDLQHAIMAGGTPSPAEELGHGHHEDIWLLTGTLHATLSTLFLSLCSAQSVTRGCSFCPCVALMVSHLPAEQNSHAQQPGHSGQPEHSSSPRCSWHSGTCFPWSGWLPYIQGLCIYGIVLHKPTTLPTSTCSSGLIPQCLASPQWLSGASSLF